MAEAEALLAAAEEAKAQQIEKDGIRGWIGYTFPSSSGKTPEWMAFYKDIQKHLHREFKGWKFKWSNMHFEFSVFLTNPATNKIVYVSCSDVRYFKDRWYNNLLIRTAKTETDYTGGPNNWATLMDLRKTADRLTV